MLFLDYVVSKFYILMVCFYQLSSMLKHLSSTAFAASFSCCALKNDEELSNELQSSCVISGGTLILFSKCRSYESSLFEVGLHTCCHMPRKVYACFIFPEHQFLKYFFLGNEKLFWNIKIVFIYLQTCILFPHDHIRNSSVMFKQLSYLETCFFHQFLHDQTTQSVIFKLHSYPEEVLLQLLCFKCPFCTSHLTWKFLITEFNTAGVKLKGNKVKLCTIRNWFFFECLGVLKKLSRMKNHLLILSGQSCVECLEKIVVTPVSKRYFEEIC